MSTETPRGTRASSPDLDWSQVRETVLMLERDWEKPARQILDWLGKIKA